MSRCNMVSNLLTNVTAGGVEALFKLTINQKRNVIQICKVANEIKTN